MKNQKGFVVPLIISIIAILAIGGGVYYYKSHNFTTTPLSPIVGGDSDIHGCKASAGYSWCEVKNKCLRVWEEKCEVDKTQPSISSVVPSYGSIGASVELKGHNLLSNRGDQNLMIENSNGEKASLGFGDPTHLNTSEGVGMKFVVSEKVCKDFATDAGLPCKNWMTIVPGEYKIYVVGPSHEFFTSNKVNFTITAKSTSCTPNWQCGWGECKNGYQGMTAVDSNNCGVSSAGVQIACPALARVCSN